MPQQELFLEQIIGDRRIEVLKTYDQQYAREAFSNMDSGYAGHRETFALWLGLAESALRSLWSALKPEDIYDPANLPSLDDPNDVSGEAEAFLWDEMVDQARERDNLFSFFVVNEIKGGHSESVYFSPDWPSAEAFAKSRVSGVQI